MLILGLMDAIDGIPTAKGEMIYGSLDILPRINMAVRLAEYHRLSGPLVKRIIDVRKALQGKGTYDGLAARRNQIVHGAHRDLENGATTLTMVRWRGEKRDKTFTALEIHELAVELLNLGDEVWAIGEDFGKWKFGDHGSEDDGREGA